jgi:hypothetical protein
MEERRKRGEERRKEGRKEKMKPSEPSSKNTRVICGEGVEVCSAVPWRTN